MDETGEYLVTDTISHIDPTVVYLTISGETLTTTIEHPFYTADGEWVNAGDLPIGEEILALDGSIGVVEGVEVVADSQPMYNLTVADAHTFFVGDGQWLVHNTNKNCLPDGGNKPSEALISAGNRAKALAEEGAASLYGTKNYPTTYSVAVSSKTGKVYTGAAGRPLPKDIHPTLANRRPNPSLEV